MENRWPLCYSAKSVKPTLIHVVLLILRWIVISVSGFGLVFAVTGTMSPLVYFLPRISVVAAILAVFLTYLRSVTRRVHVAVLLALFYPLVILTFAVPVLTPVVDRPEIPSLNLPVPTILHGRGHSLFVDNQTGGELGNVVVVRHHSPPHLDFFPQVIWNSREETLLLRGGETLSSREVMGLGRTPLPPAVIALRTDLDTVLELVRFDPQGATSAMAVALAHILALSAAVVMAWGCARASRWLLVNTMVTLFYGWLLLALPRLLAAPAVQGLFTRFPLPLWVTDYLPVIGWVLLAVILLVVALVQPPLTTWQREIGSGDGR